MALALMMTKSPSPTRNHLFSPAAMSGHADGRLAGRVPRLLGVGGVGQQQADAVVGRNGADPRQVGEPTVDRSQVELEVARMQHDPLRRVEGGGETMRDRMGHGYELDIEGADAAALA